MSKSETDVPECPRCGGAMEEGVVVDFGNNNVQIVPVWREGRPQGNYTGQVGHDDKCRFRVLTYRCVKCGRLESFASEPFSY